MSLSFGFKPPATKPVVSNNTIGRSFIPPALQVLPIDKFLTVTDKARLTVQGAIENVKNVVNNIPQTVDTVTKTIGSGINNIISPASGTINRTIATGGLAGATTILPIGIAIALIAVVALKVVK